VRRAVDIVVMLVLGVVGLSGLRDAWGTIQHSGVTGWPGVVVCGQVVMAGGAFWTILALLRSPRRAPTASLVWALGAFIAGTVATFAWSTYDPKAFLGACVSVILVGGALYWWLRRRLRAAPARPATTS
jgi:hypothetical protein